MTSGQWSGDLEITSGEGQGMHADAMLNVDRDRPQYALLNCALRGGSFKSGTRGAALSLRAVHTEAEAKDFKWRGSINTVFDQNFNVQAPNDATRAQVYEVNATLIENDPVEGMASLTGHVVKDAQEVAKFKIYRADLKVEGLRLTAERSSWVEFREWALAQPRDQYVYRGHKSSEYRIVSSIHRKGRCDMQRFNLEDQPDMRRLYTDYTGIRIAQDFVEINAILSLAQHYGYPTPLLDCSKSPFVAAFFAFDSHAKLHADDDYVRIFAIKKRDLAANPPPNEFVDPRPCLQFIVFPAKGNMRALYQQSVFIFTNVVHIESLLKGIMDAFPDRVVAKAFDIHRSERPKAMADLALMNVTAASLFQGLEGLFKYFSELHHPDG